MNRIILSQDVKITKIPVGHKLHPLKFKIIVVKNSKMQKIDLLHDRYYHVKQQGRKFQPRVVIFGIMLSLIIGILSFATLLFPYESQLDYISVDLETDLTKNDIQDDDKAYSNSETEVEVDNHDENLTINNEPVDTAVENEQGEMTQVHKVCVRTWHRGRLTPILRENQMGKFTKKYLYMEKHSQCPSRMRAVKSLNYQLGRHGTTMDSVKEEIEADLPFYDLLVLSTDEFCRFHDDRIHFRHYYDEITQTHPRKVTQFGDTKVPHFAYFPLGLRPEFKSLQPGEQIIPATKRKLLFNFLGTLTSENRQLLQKLLIEYRTKHPTELAKVSIVNETRVSTNSLSKKYLVQFINTWSKDISAGEAVPPPTYRKILMDSIFTLCPLGHNPESYRIYEACEVGSIPILVMDKYYEEHECKNAFFPFLNSSAPFVFFKSWTELAPYLESLNPAKIIQQQQQVREWYKRFMIDAATKFELMLEHRYKQRMARLDAKGGESD